MLDSSKVRDTIVKTVRDELAPCAVRVNVSEREGAEDETVYVVTVSIEDDQAPDRRKMLGLIRNIRLSLDALEINETVPMLSFIAQNEEHQSGLEFA